MTSSQKENLYDQIEATEAKLKTLKSKLETQELTIEKRFDNLISINTNNEQKIAQFIGDYITEQDTQRAKAWSFLIDNTIFKAITYGLLTGTNILFIYYVTTDPNTRFKNGLDGIITASNIPVVVFGVLLTIGFNLVISSVVAQVQKRLEEKDTLNTLKLTALIAASEKNQELSRREFEKEQREYRAEQEQKRLAHEAKINAQEVIRKAQEAEAQAARKAQEADLLVLRNEITQLISTLKEQVTK